MAVRNIAITDTLEKFRQEFNALAANDFGDKANLSAAISSTNLVDAMNETISIATSTAGWTMEDSSSSQQIVGGGQVARFLGTSNQINAVVSSPDTLTMSLNSVVEVTTSVKAGTLTIAAGTVSDTSGSISFDNENLTTTGNIQAADLTGSGTLTGNTLKGNTIQSRSGGVITFPATESIRVDGNLYFGPNATNLFFEGSTGNTNETQLTVTDPTADRIITLPDNTGTVITTGSTDAIVEDMMANDAIGSAELKNVQTLIIYDSSGTAVKTLYCAGS